MEAIEAKAVELTPRHLLRQLEPSLLVSGHTTSLLASETENEPVNEARGGIVCIYLSRSTATGEGETEKCGE